MRHALVAAAVLAAISLRVVAVFRTAFSWDEFVLFDAVARTLEDGLLRSGGRPGLAQLLVMPLVEGCRDEAFVGHLARGLWLGFTLAYLVGLFVLLLALLRERAHRVHDAALGVGLLALLPAFLEWSVQVRTDQIALCGAVWGGIALLHSERRSGAALLAGLAFGLGWLASQKLAYGAALVGLLAAGRLWIGGSFDPRREGRRAVLVLVGFGAVLLGFRAVLTASFTLPETHAAKHVLGPNLAGATHRVFPFYRETIGFSQYVALLPTLVPHLCLGVGLAASTLLATRRRERDRRTDLAWGVIALGLAVGAFHAAAFSYFWMTLGLFPAVAGAIAIAPLRERLAKWRPDLLRPAALLLWTALTIPALFAHAALLHDAQAVQRDSLAFVRRNFAPRHGGFHPEGGRFCAEPQLSGTWLSQRIFGRFEHADAEARAAQMVNHFRVHPPQYLIQSFRLNQFPLSLRRFWAEHYQPYRDAVFVAGRRLEADASPVQHFDLLVSGSYRWLPQNGPSAVTIDGRRLEPGAITLLDAGVHTAALSDPTSRGLLVLSLNDPPGPAPRAFYPAN